jgi:hypothetical protein
MRDFELIMTPKCEHKDEPELGIGPSAIIEKHPHPEVSFRGFLKLSMRQQDASAS